MIFRSVHLVRFALASLFVLGAAACAGETEEAPGEQGAEQSETDETAGKGETVEANGASKAVPTVDSNTTTPQDGIGEKGSSCPIWQCGFNGLEPAALKLAPRFLARAGNR